MSSKSRHSTVMIKGDGVERLTEEEMDRCAREIEGKISNESIFELIGREVKWNGPRGKERMRANDMEIIRQRRIRLGLHVKRNKKKKKASKFIVENEEKDEESGEKEEEISKKRRKLEKNKSDAKNSQNTVSQKESVESENNALPKCETTTPDQMSIGQEIIIPQVVNVQVDIYNQMILVQPDEVDEFGIAEKEKILKSVVERNKKAFLVKKGEFEEILQKFDAFLRKEKENFDFIINA